MSSFLQASAYDQPLLYDVHHEHKETEVNIDATQFTTGATDDEHQRLTHSESSAPSTTTEMLSEPVAGAGTVATSDEVAEPDDGIADSDVVTPIKFSWRLLLRFVGPGWLMSIAYLDPGNLESDLQAGAYAGYQLIWVLFWSTFLGWILQCLAARLGVVTGKHLAQVCRENYSPHMAKMLWLATELAIIGSDIQEVIGSAIAFKILFGLPLWAGVLITGFDTFTFMLLHALGVRKLEAFFALLIGTMSICFFVDFGYIGPSGKGMAKGMIPEVSDYAVVQAVSILGAVIMPHNIYLHSALVQSRAINRARPRKVKEANYYFAVEGAIALFVSFLINLAVVAVFAKGFFDPVCAEQGLARVRDDVGEFICDTIGLQGAGSALESLLGSSAKIVWAIGLLAAGQSSTMTGTFSGQYVMEGFLTIRLPQWKRVLFTRSIALVPAIIVAVLSGESDSHTGDTVDEYLNILQSIQLPFALLPILHFTSSERIMTKDFVNSPKFRIFGWSVALGVIGINFYLIVSQILDFSVSGLPDTWWMYLILIVIICVYVCFIVFIVWNDLAYALAWIKKKGKFDQNTSLDGLREQFDQPAVGSPNWYITHHAFTAATTGRQPNDVAEVEDNGSAPQSTPSSGNASINGGGAQNSLLQKDDESVVVHSQMIDHIVVKSPSF